MAYSILSFLGFIPELLILGISLVYMVQSNTTDGKLLFFGSLIGLATRGLFSLLPMFVEVSELDVYYGLASFAGLVGATIFCAGFALLIKRSLPAKAH